MKLINNAMLHANAQYCNTNIIGHYQRNKIKTLLPKVAGSTGCASLRYSGQRKVITAITETTAVERMRQTMPWHAIAISGQTQ